MGVLVPCLRHGGSCRTMSDSSDQVARSMPRRPKGRVRDAFGACPPGRASGTDLTIKAFLPTPLARPSTPSGLVWRGGAVLRRHPLDLDPSPYEPKGGGRPREGGGKEGLDREIRARGPLLRPSGWRALRRPVGEEAGSRKAIFQHSAVSVPEATYSRRGRKIGPGE